MSGPRPAPAPVSAFAALGLTRSLQRACAELGFVEPTAVQAQAIPPALDGHDLIARAPTGSGKTAAYALALLHRFDITPRTGRRVTRALLLVPTRELAVQAGQTLRSLARHMAEPVKVAVLFGGVSVNPQMMGLRGGAEVVVATPGRLLDLVERNALQLDAVQLLVLDEADRLLDDGFADELERVLALLPPERQHLLFSATFPASVQALAARLLQEPVRVEVDAAPEAGGPAIEQHAVEVDTAQRTALLRRLLALHDWPRVLVFVATRHASEHVADKLQRAGIAAAAFHGELSQGARTRVLGDLHSGRLRVVLATDMAARGLHIPGLAAVVNYDLPRSPADYTHRIGRTARAGAAGVAWSFVPAAGEAHFRLIEKRQGQRVARERIEGFEPRESAPPPSPAEGGIKGRRKSRKDKLREAAAAAAG
ncbi:RNA helicase [Rubrivivax gelatinosus]|nr:RNA helicase [Rubrivivax gelatinosus]